MNQLQIPGFGDAFPKMLDKLTIYKQPAAQRGEHVLVRPTQAVKARERVTSERVANPAAADPIDGRGKRDTSVKAFHDHKDSGKLSRQQQAIVDFIGHPDASLDYTRSEIGRYIGLQTSAVCGRCNELIKLGKLVELPRRECRITGKSAHPVRLA